MTTLKVNAAGAGQRLDVWLASQCAGLSRSRIQALIREGRVAVGGKTVKAHQRLARGVPIEIDIPAPVPVEMLPEDIPLCILYEDADVLVVNKPAGLVVHPAVGHWSGTLVNALLHHCRDLAGIGGETRPGLVHRLDKDTTGAIVVAKNDLGARRLMQQFKARRVRKEYLAVVWGKLTPPAGRIETLLGRSRQDRQKMSTSPLVGRSAVTHYESLEVFASASLIRLRLETGRTHQIRVHMSHLGHPVVGDRKYGHGRSARCLPFEVDRQMLHAELLAFKHPRTGEQLEFRAPLPGDMQALLDSLRTRAATAAQRER